MDITVKDHVVQFAMSKNAKPNVAAGTTICISPKMNITSSKKEL